MRTLTLIHQWINTGSGNCPAAYDVRDAPGAASSYAIQGKTRDLDRGTVWVPPDIIDRLPEGAIPTATRAADGGYLVTGQPMTDASELAQVVDFGGDEAVVYIASETEPR